MYRDRRDAGAAVAAVIEEAHPRFPSTPLVVGLPRGGVPVADVVAHALGAPLEIWVAKKVGAPGHNEVGVGAVGEGGAVVLDDDTLRRCGLLAIELTDAVEEKKLEVAAKARHLRGGRPSPNVRGRTVIVVDDGVANGVTATAALRDLRAAGASELILVVPVGSAEGLSLCRREADEVLCPLVPRPFRSVGEHYADFTQVEDAEVETILASSSSSSSR